MAVTKELYVRDERSYYEQFEDLKGANLELIKAAHPKPSNSRNALAPTAHVVPGSGGVIAVKCKRPLKMQPKTLTPEEVERFQSRNIMWRNMGFFLVHATLLVGGLLSFSWSNLAIGIGVYMFCILIGSTIGYHRLLTHRSFKTYRWVEYICAYVGLHNMQGPPMEWVSNHRYHHLHCDTPLDPHSTYEGFWHAHMGWLFKDAQTERPYLDRENVKEMAVQPFYQHIERYWVAHMWARMLITLALGGWQMVVWAWAAPIFIAWHATFLVNSGAHMYGSQPFDTGDLSRNNWWVNAIGLHGEGWHNNHHAFASSCKYGLEWWQIDLAYTILCAMRALGLAWDLKVPSARDMERRSKPDGSLKTW